MLSTSLGQVLSVGWEAGGRGREGGRLAEGKHFGLFAAPPCFHPDKSWQIHGIQLPEERFSPLSTRLTCFQLLSPWNLPFWQWCFPPEILYGLGVGQRREGLGAQPEKGLERGGRLREEKQLELISWGRAKKEAQALGNLLASLMHPLPASFSVCVTRDSNSSWQLPATSGADIPARTGTPTGREDMLSSCKEPLART